MAATKYTYSIANDFLNSVVASTPLTSEINNSSVSGTLSHVNTNSDNCDIWFESSLSSPDETTLSGVVSTHDGQQTPSEYTVIAGEDVGARKGVYISGSDEVKLARADSENTLPCVGFTEAAAVSGTEVTVWTNDILGGFSGLTPAAEYYLSTIAAGEITTTKPSSGNIISVGVGKTATELDIHIAVLPPDASVYPGSIDIAINGYSSQAYMASSNTTYKVASYFVFPGSIAAGTPSSIKAIATIGTADSFDARIYDYTNSKVIAEIVGSTNASIVDSVDMGALSNIPSQPATWEVQIRRNSGNGSESVWMAGVSVIL